MTSWWRHHWYVMRSGGRWPISPRPRMETLPLGRIDSHVSPQCAMFIRPHPSGGNCNDLQRNVDFFLTMESLNGHSVLGGCPPPQKNRDFHFPTQIFPPTEHPLTLKKSEKSSPPVKDGEYYRTLSDVNQGEQRGHLGFCSYLCLLYNRGEGKPVRKRLILRS